MNNDFFAHLLKYQAIYALVVSLVISWTLLGSRLNQVENSLLKHEILIEKNTSNSNDILARLASIETSLEFIKQKLK